MTQRRRGEERSLQVHIQFEQSRWSAIWLTEAYEQVLPVRERPVANRPTERRVRTGSTSDERRDA